MGGGNIYIVAKMFSKMQRGGGVLNREFLILFSAVLILLLASFVFAEVTITRTDYTTNSFNFNEDLSLAYNFTINATIASIANSQANNITQVNVTLPSSFVLLTNSTNSSQGTGSTSGFSISGSVLSWINATAGIINVTVTTGVNQTFGFNATALTPGIYNLTIVVTNWSNTYNRNLTVYINDTTLPALYLENISLPLLHRVNVSGTIRLNVSVADNSIINSVRFNITNSSGSVSIINATNPDSIYWNGTMNTANFADGVYNLTVIANDTYGAGNINDSARIEIVIDNTPPGGSISCSPSTVQTGDTVTCSCGATDALSGVNSTSTIGTLSTTQTGTFAVSCSATDKSGNTATLSGQYTVGNSGGGSSSGSSGSGSTSIVWARTEDQSTTDLQVSEGGAVPRVSANLGARERVKINVRTAEHHVGIVSLTATTAVLEVSSNPQRSTFNVGETKQFDVEGDGSDDIAVMLVSIQSSKANIQVVALARPVEAPQEETASTPVSTPEEAESSKSTLWIVGIILLIIIATVVFFVMKRKR